MIPADAAEVIAAKADAALLDLEAVKAHGKRTGHWWGPKEYRNCVECHDAHAPAWKPIEPRPPPVRPDAIRLAPGARLEEVSHEPS
jgi:hypothetical protein